MQYQKDVIKKVEDWLNHQYNYMPDSEIEELNAEQNIESAPSSPEEPLESASVINYQSTFIDLEEVEDLETPDFKGLSVESVARFRQVLRRKIFGISLSEFNRKYQQMYGRPLHKHGFTSIKKMLQQLDKVFFLEEIEDPEDDRLPVDEEFRFLIHDTRNANILPKRKIAIKREENEIRESEQICWFNCMAEIKVARVNDCEVDLKSSGFKSKLEFFEKLCQLIPIQIFRGSEDKNCLKFKSMEKIEEFISELIANQNYKFLREIDFPKSPRDFLIPSDGIPVRSIQQLFNEIDGQIKPIYVTYLVSYQKFFGVILEEEFLNLWKEMETFYGPLVINADLTYYDVPKVFVIPGFVCAAKCPQNGWIRAKVVELPLWRTNSDGKETPIKLKALDFEYEFEVDIKNIKLLKKEFASLVSQTIKFRLNGVKNAKKKRFYKLLYENHRGKRVETPNDELFCQMVAFNEDAIEVIVFETDDLYDYYSIGHYMIEMQWAQQTEEYGEPDWELLQKTIQEYYKLSD